MALEWHIPASSQKQVGQRSRELVVGLGVELVRVIPKENVDDRILLLDGYIVTISANFFAVGLLPDLHARNLKNPHCGERFGAVASATLTQPVK